MGKIIGRALIAALMASTVGAAMPAHASAVSNVATARSKAEPDGARSSIPNLDLEYEQFTLPNGLTVIVYPDHSVPDVMVSMTYKVGAKDEPEGKSGFAHLFEHLMFQETENRKGEYFAPFQDNAITDINGSTTADVTNYYQVVPAEALDLALWMESDRMQYLAIDQAALDSQRAVVKNEKRESETPQSAAQADAFRAVLYPKSHPYSHSVIGSMEDLDNASVADVRDWFDRYYGASNAVLMLAGDIDVATAREKVGHYFADVRPGEAIQRVDEWIPDLGTGRTLEFSDKIATAKLSRTWPVPRHATRDGALLQAFAGVIASGRNSPLSQALVEGGGPAYEVSATYDSAAVNGLFTIALALKPDADIAAVDRTLDETLAGLFAEGPDQRRLDQNLAAADESLLQSLENPAFIGGILAGGAVNTGNPESFLTIRDWQLNARAEEIGEIAGRWLDKPYVRILTRPEPETAPAVAGSVDRSAPPAVGEPARAAIAFPDIETAQLPSGIEIVLAHRPRLPLVNVAISFDTGRFIDRDYPAQLANLTFSSLFQASEDYTSEQMVEQLQALNLRPVANVGDRHSTIAFSTTSPKFPAVFGFVADVLKSPVFPQDKLDEYMETVDPTFDGMERDPASWQSALYQQLAWGRTHPYGRIEQREAVKQITREDLVRFYRNELAPSNMKIFMVGDIDMAGARALVERNFAGWHEDVRPARFVSTPPAQPDDVRVVLIDVPGATQSSIVGGRLVGPWTPEGWEAESITNQALGGGFSSRINLNLREEKGWTYGIQTRISETLNAQRNLYVSGSVEADRTADAIREIRREIDSFAVDSPLLQEEFDAQKDTLVRSLSDGLSSNGGYLSALIDADARGVPYDYLASVPQSVAAISLDDARFSARDLYRTDDFRWVIAGDLSKIEADIRSLDLGPVEIRDAYGNQVASRSEAATR